MTHRTARRFAAALSCAALVVLSGCAADDSTDNTSAEDSSAPSPADDETTSEATPSEPAATQSATCKLSGKAGGKATLEQTDNGLVMTFSGLSVPSSGVVLYSVTAYDEAGENGGQLGVKYQDGEQIGYFVFDFGSAEQTNLEGSPEASDDTLTASVADADLGPLSGIEVASWSAAYSVDGEDVGTCPGGIDSLPFPG